MATTTSTTFAVTAATEAFDCDEAFRRAHRLLEDRDLDIYGSKKTLAQRRDNAAEPTTPTQQTTTLRRYGFIVPDAARRQHVRGVNKRAFALWPTRDAVASHETAPLVCEVQFKTPPSELYIYALTLRTSHFNGRTYYFDAAHTREARPFTRDMLGVLLRDVFYVEPSRFTIFTACDDDDARRLFTLLEFEAFARAELPRDEAVRVRTDATSRCFFLDAELRTLGTYFRGQARALERLRWSDVASLHWRLHHEPYKLCFRRKLPTCVNEGYDNESLDPLLLEDARAAHRAFHASSPIDVTFELAVYAFEHLQTMLEEQQHGYAEHDEIESAMANHYASLQSRGGGGGATRAEVFTAATRLLVDELKLVVRLAPHDDATRRLAPRWQLCWVHEAEVAMVDALRMIARRRGTSVNARLGSADEAVASLGLCSEQAEAWRSITRGVLTVVDGQGGSGKSELLRKLCARVPAEWFYCTAPTSVACANLARDVANRAQNMHKLVHSHAALLERDGTHVCESEPPAARLAHPVRVSDIGIACRRCHFEEIRILFMDEFFLAAGNISGPLWLMIAACAPHLEKIVVVGDHRQLPPISWGYLGLEMFETLRPSTALVSFQHNHRTACDTLVHNNRMTHAEMPSQLIFDNVSTFHVRIGATSYERDEQLQQVAAKVVETLVRHAIGEYECLIVTRTNDFRIALCHAVTRHYMSLERRSLDGTLFSKTLYVNRKYVFTANRFEMGIVAKQLLVLEAIEDVMFATKPTLLETSEFLRTSPLYDLERDVRSMLPVDAAGVSSRNAPHVDIAYQTSTHARLADERVRFLVFRDLNEFARRKSTATTTTAHDDKTFVRIPADPKLTALLRDAGCVTVYGAQSSQVPKLIYVLPFFSRFDTTPCVYTAGSRAQRCTFYVCNLPDLARAIQNPEPRRRASFAPLLRAALPEIFPDFAERTRVVEVDTDDDFCDDDVVALESSPKRRRT